MRLIIDGDIVAFMAAAVEPDDFEAAKQRTLEVIEDIQESLFCEDYEIFVKGDGNFRHSYDDYKSNRKGERPATLEPIRDFIATLGTRAHGAEADDYCVIAAQESLDRDEPYIIATVDKDLRQMPGIHYNIRRNETSRVTEEEGFYFLMQQCIMGDSGDGIQGIRGLGPKKSAAILDEADDLPKAVAATWQKYFPDDWEERLAKVYNLVYIRRYENELGVLPLPEMFQ